MNHFFTLLLAASCLTAVGQVPDYVPTDGLVGWWGCDGSAEDASGNETDLIEVGDIHFESDRSGNTESAILFDGSDGESRVEFPDFSFIDGWNQGTLSFWVNVVQHDVTGHYFGFDNMFSVRQQHGVNTQFMIGLQGGTTNIRVHLNGSLPNSGDLVSQQSLEIGQWHLVTITFNSGDGVQYVYIDGDLDNTITSEASITSLASPDMLAFGFYGGCGSGSSNSLMDEIGLWDRALNALEVQALFSMTAPTEGCTEESACNFDSGATIDDGSCHFLCQYCKEGTVWDEEVQGCIVAIPSDSNFDGCVQLNDLLDLLGAYGDCGAEGSAWQCGDPLEYQSHGYETVQIGEQCWFAENLRVENYKNGDFIPANLDNSEWTSTTSGATVFYGDDVSSLQAYGRLYNWHAVDDARSLCPNTWRIPSDGDWTVLTNFLGGSATAGAQMKTTYGWNGNSDGANSSGFSGLPGGSRASNGNFYLAGSSGYWWSSTPYGSSAWYRIVSYNDDSVNRNFAYHRNGYSVRCVRDAQ